MTRILHNVMTAVCAVILIIAAGCRNDIIWSQSSEVPSEGWMPSDMVEFNLDPSAYDPKPSNRFAEITARAIGDTAVRNLGIFRASLAIRYLEDCNASEISLIAEKAGLDESISTDTLRIPLFDSSGRPVGKGRFGIYETSVDIFPFKVAEGTVISFRPMEFKDTIRGITDLTLLLHKNPTNNSRPSTSD